MTGRIVSALCIAILIAGSGCAMRQAASPDRASLRALREQDIHWPARWAGDLNHLAARLPDHLSFDIPQFEQDEQGQLVTTHKQVPFAEVVARRATAMGVLLQINFTSAGLAGMWQSRPVQSDVYSMKFYSWLSAPPGDDTDLAQQLLANRVGTSGTLFMPQGRDPVGLAVFIGGGTEFDWPLRWDVLREGWAIIQAGSDGAPVDAPGQRRFVVDADHPVSEVAPELARRVDDQIAEDVYAAHAFITYAHEQVPALQSTPLVIVGFSRGSFSVPALVARLDDRVAAAIVVGAGANVPFIALETAEKQYSLELSGPETNGKPTPLSAEMRDALLDAYLGASQLDPYRTAPVLSGVPTLMIQGMFDQIVPASTGKVLYERLGKPERWSYPLGHGGVFWSLKNDRRLIVAWIDKQALGVKPQADSDASSGR